jgi:7,8-dihydropterin-6-yl-methyl-4-(beta-D-ribofuranosyl)aminobenzene 5'-phosphate synthase
MVDYAIEITGIRKVEAVMGGFHLKNMDAKTSKTIEYLRERKVNRVLPSHCTRQPALGEFHSAFGMEQVIAGKEYRF